MRNFTLYNLYIRNAKNYGKEIALVEDNKRITYSQLLSQVNMLASGLAKQGIEKGDRVAVLAMNQSYFFTIFGAISHLGAIMVPLNWRLSDDEIGYIIEDSEAKILFADDNHITRGQGIIEKTSNPVTLASLTDDMGKCMSSEPVGVSPATGDTPCCIIYTAAVEGSPRGAVLSHNNLISANLQVIISLGLTPKDVNLNMLPLFHITGLNLALAVMQVGGKNVVVEKFNEAQTLALTEKEKVTVWGSFPPILQRTISEIDKGQYDVSSLRYAVGLDGQETIEQFEKATSARFWILYGQTETSGFVTFSPASDKFGTAGQQSVISTFMLVDGNDIEVPVGEVGEIVVRGPLVFQGYWNQDKVNERTFRNDWHHTGDFGMADEEGYLHFKGRKPEKELIKPGGENVYPVEVEAVILEHPEVESVSVIGVPDPKFGEGVKAVCVRKSGSTLDAESLIQFVGSRIARYKKPGYVQFVDELPVGNNKIDRQKVKELYGS